METVSTPQKMSSQRSAALSALIYEAAVLQQADSQLILCIERNFQHEEKTAMELRAGEGRGSVKNMTDKPEDESRESDTASETELTQRFHDEALPLIHQLFGAAMKMTQNPSDAEDLVQETYIKAYINFASFTQGTNIRAWLYKILTNTYINIYRQKQRRPQQVHSEQISDWQLIAAAEHSPTGLKSAEIEALELLPDPEINRALHALPEEYRMAVYYADVEGLPYKEIAEIMEIPVGTVMSRLHRGRSQLKKTLLNVALDRGIIHSAIDKSQV